ncbi:TonB-dependent receptor [Sulfitobacter sp. M57]|uniref:TonB-dependent receptor domain-containing protein n=1 Tax=unclassified Sulfitobacter TaxID=196795 RepID=UPI0023E0DEBD|nr:MULTISPECIES: TonB-dependent receptor [unclassified Sulfitobacter]MDF3415092.1 TonB-dependent receptor [Sulfitobacter sp. KE5]MDF3422573.1 TonB-dependent receptor [Sulfitobacter sp. KE43]MDF3433638.1 TonB-dependent receptor [Sulfitobacter sp. KE42]MDF3459278.1 TonB-dependent receptor [Sulfitobacter sp. S74]MDF3463177.1 TonB-dependent receptor [Sulfitobacter sp. Ks18]
MRSLLSFTSVLALVSAQAVWAQTADQFLLGTIVLETSSANDVGVDADDLERNDPGDLQDVFKNEPTVSVSSSVPLSQKVFVNGIEETNLATTIDGARQNNKIFHHNATTYIDPEILKQVRIDPGVAPADAGPGALAGSIGYETKDVDDLLAPGLGFGGILSSEYTSNGDGFSTSLTLFGRSGPVEALGYVKVANGDIRTNGDGNDILGSAAGLHSGLFKVALNAQNGGRFELSYEDVEDDELRPYRADIGLLAGGRPVPATRRYVLNRRNLAFNYTTTQTTEMWDPKFSLSYSVTDLGLLEDSQQSDGTTDSISGSFQNTFTLQNGSVTAGMDFYRDEAENIYRSFSNPAFNQASTEKSRNVGIFAQGRFDLGDRTKLSTGLRYDWNKLTGIEGSTFSDSGLSANITGEFAVNDILTLSAGASSVWGGIPLAENFIFNTAWVYPDHLEAVTAKNYFLSANADLGAWNLKAKLFRTDLENARTASYRAGPGVTADASSKGFELGASYAWERGFFSIGYSDIDSTVNGFPADGFTGRYLTQPFGEMLTMAVAHEFEQHDLTVGVDAQFAFSLQGSYAGAPTNVIESYEVVNAFAEWNPKQYKNFTLRGEINNVFDQTYAERGTYGQEFANDGVTPLYEPGRSISIRGTLRF